MTERFDDLLARYDYDLPSSYIAQAPASPRDSARLMVCRKADDAVSLDTFTNLAAYLPPRSVVVFNETKVLPARLHGKKQTGGHVELLYVRTEAPYVLMIANKRLEEGQRITITDNIFFTVQERREKGYAFLPSVPLDAVHGLLERYGETPIPPYIKETPLTESELKEEYQTVFAREYGSSAAPTASLHFTEALIEEIRRKGHDVRFVTLHVGLGTFAPLTESHVAEGRLHTETYVISPETAAFLNKAKGEGRPIVAVGTTVVRTLESAASETGKLERLEGDTALFIKEGYQFRFVLGIVTNFHVPRSSLLMLVAAFIGREKLLDLYERAKKEHFRFFSFGDGMLLK